MLDLFSGLPTIKRYMENFERTGRDIVEEAEAGAGLVRVRANGHGRILAIHIDQELLRQPDRETLEELLVAACNQALTKAREKFSAEVNRSLANPDLVGSLLGDLLAGDDEDDDDSLLPPDEEDSEEIQKKPSKKRRGGKKSGK